LVRQARALAVITDRQLPVHAARERAVPGDLRVLRLADPINPSQHGESVVLKLTSGSTDLPKAAVASEMQLINDGRHVIEAMGIAPSDINLAYIPLSHSYAIGNLIMPLLWQGTPLALRQSFNPSQLVNDVRVSDATVFPGVPFMFEHLKSLDQIDHLPSSLRLLITAGARIDASTVSWFRRRLDRKVHSFYGSSETGGIAYDDSEEVTDPLHVGRPMPETNVAVRPPDGDRAAGRVFVRGNAVASRYAGGDREHSVSEFCDGGFLTADLGHFDDEGRVVLTGRASALVNVAGRKVDPAEVERTLVEFPGVADARVLGMSCDKRGQQVVAFVVRADRALTPVAIRQLCAARLSTHKIPRRFVFLDRFPVDARGKVDRRALQALVSSAGEDLS
jgi:long-chain acyl-CoA synthetase